MNNKAVNIVLIICVVGITAAVLLFKEKKPLKELPYYGNKKADSLANNESYHKVSNFSFIGQEGKIITQKNLENKIYVVDYFFTTCKSICPVMTNQMQHIYDVFKNEDKVRFISHTVDPEFDSVNVLAEYAKTRGADPEKWFFVTGDKKQLYDMGRKSYLLNVEEGDGGPDDFIHTPDFVLVDENKHIRGYYDGTDSLQVDMLIKDIRILLKASDK